MGIKWNKRRRLESAKNIPVEVLTSLASHDVHFEKYDESLLYDKINKKIDDNLDNLYGDNDN